MKTAKWLAVLSLVVLVALALSACGGAAAPTTAPAAPTTAPAAAQPTTAPQAAAPVEIVYMRQAEGSQTELDLIDQFNKTHPNIQVKVDSVPAGDNYSKLVLTTQAGNPPDVYMSYFTLGAATNGMALDLGPYIKKEGDAWFNNLSQNGWVFHEYAGKYYGVPWRVAPSMVIFNADLLKKAGLEVPLNWTWDDFVKYAKAMTHPDKDEYGFCFMGSAEDPGTDYQFYPFLFEAGGVMINEKGLSGFNTPAGEEALKWMSDLINVHKVVPPATTSATANTCTDLLAAGKVGMWMNASLWVGIIRGNKPGVNLALAPMPVGKTTGALIGGTGFSISPKSKNPDAAWEFIKFMVDSKNIRQWAEKFSFTPANIDILKDPTFTSNPDQKAVAAAMLNQKMYALSHYPDNADLEGKLRTYLQAAYLGKMTPKDALTKAAAEWDPILTKYQADNWWAAWLPSK